MAIYTKSGDGGETDRGDGQRARKSNARVVVLGEIDELNAHIGLCLSACSASGHGEVAEMLHPIQGELMTAAAMVAGSPAGKAVRLEEGSVARMEKQIDAAWAELRALEHFIVPGGCELACRLHLARAVCRRAERAVVAYGDSGGAVPPGVLKYLNRLSDLLFALARLTNRNAGVDEQTWPK